MKTDVGSPVVYRPADWPSPGPIDLALHDLPHDSSSLEWWYVNAHAEAADGREFSVFAAFFRLRAQDETAPEKTHAHFLTWGLTDVRANRYSAHTLLDPRSPRIAIHDIEAKADHGDGRLIRALREVLEKGKLPLPDRLMSRSARVDRARLDLDFDGNRFHKRTDGAYELDLVNDVRNEGARLRFTLEKPVVRHGDDGVVRGVEGEDMFYYFSPRCRVEGQLLVNGEWIDVETGSGWYDHEFGRPEETSSSEANSSPSDMKVAWNWVSAQLDNGFEVSGYDLFDAADPSISHGRWVIVIDPGGERTAYTDFTFEAFDPWTSTRTFNEFPTRYRVDVPDANLSLEVTAAIANQEIITLMSAPSFWEGRVSVRGTMNGRPVSGLGYVERSGLSSVRTTDDFFASIGRETRRHITALLPEEVDETSALALMGGRVHASIIDNVDLAQYSRTVIKPIREIILRGGKAWRSYGVLACIDLVGGQSQPFANWLALPELLHVGSLIIDDVQDASDIRRGGPAAHKLYGEALAINAGCAAYFLAQIPIPHAGIDARTSVRIYEAYFDVQRAAHAGQALDIDGLTRMMPHVVESGDAGVLESRVIATHSLKSAAPAAAVARVAAILGGGTDEQADAIGKLFEAFGVSFQIIDDVLNLRGFKENSKNRGEDITAGKITAPVAKAMGRLSLDERRELASILDSRPSDRASIQRAIAIIDGCGALDACEADARARIETAWASMESLVPDSYFKVRLRAFSWFILDRTY